MHCVPRSNFHIWKSCQSWNSSNQIATISNANFHNKNKRSKSPSGWRWVFKPRLPLNQDDVRNRENVYSCSLLFHINWENLKHWVSVSQYSVKERLSCIRQTTPYSAKSVMDKRTSHADVGSVILVACLARHGSYIQQSLEFCSVSIVTIILKYSWFSRDVIQN